MLFDDAPILGTPPSKISFRYYEKSHNIATIILSCIVFIYEKCNYISRSSNRDAAYCSQISDFIFFMLSF